MKRSAVMFIAIGGPKAHVTLSMTGTLFQQLANPNLQWLFGGRSNIANHLVVGL